MGGREEGREGGGGRERETERGEGGRELLVSPKQGYSPTNCLSTTCTLWFADCNLHSHEALLVNKDLLPSLQ